METWKIVLISIAVVLVVAAIIAAIVVPIVLKKKKAKQTNNVEVKENIPEPEKEIIQLKAVKLQNGSGMFGVEYKEELKERLSKFSKEEFLALNIEEYPWNQEQWDALEGKPEEIHARNSYEIGIFFAYNYRKELKEDGTILRREF